MWRACITVFGLASLTGCGPLKHIEITGPERPQVLDGVNRLGLITDLPNTVGSRLVTHLEKVGYGHAVVLRDSVLSNEYAWSSRDDRIMSAKTICNDKEVDALLHLPQAGIRVTVRYRDCDLGNTAYLINRAGTRDGMREFVQPDSGRVMFWWVMDSLDMTDPTIKLTEVKCPEVDAIGEVTVELRALARFLRPDPGGTIYEVVRLEETSLAIEELAAEDGGIRLVTDQTPAVFLKLFTTAIDSLRTGEFDGWKIK